MFALPIVDQRPSTVAVLEWIMMCLYRKILTPLFSRSWKWRRASQSAVTWLECSGTSKLYVDATLRRVYEVRFHRPVGDEVGVGQIDVVSWRGLWPRGTSPLWGRSSCKDRCGVPLRQGSSHAPCWGLYWEAPLCGGRSRSRRRRCPPPWRHPAHPDVRVAPSRRVQGPDVVAAEESDPAVDAHHVAVEPEDVPRVQYLRRPRKGTEVEAVYLLWEPS